MADDRPTSGPVTTLVEWRAPSLTAEAAREIATRTLEMIEHVPGFVEGRFFGEFDSGRHFYLLTWADEAALAEYARSEQMLGVRTLAEPYLEGRPDRVICSDYTPRE